MDLYQYLPAKDLPLSYSVKKQNPSVKHYCDEKSLRLDRKQSRPEMAGLFWEPSAVSAAGSHWAAAAVPVHGEEVNARAPHQSIDSHTEAPACCPPSVYRRPHCAQGSRPPSCPWHSPREPAPLTPPVPSLVAGAPARAPGSAPHLSPHSSS